MARTDDPKSGKAKEHGSEVKTHTHDDEALINEVNPRKGGQIVITDWSQTGRGFHVDFRDRETVPLIQGRPLGRGAFGDVHETTVQGWNLAHKRVWFRKRIGEKEKKEVKIMKRLSHVHIVQIIGTYTQEKILGILMYPVAVCDLHTFFEDVEAWSTVQIQEQSPEARYEALDTAQKARLEALGYQSLAKEKAWPVFSKIGCLISAVAYLHDQKIRHKDLKPSSILPSRDCLWLSDFGTATDFSLLSRSATNNRERGTERYFAPEVAEYEPSGRAADIFSLGCVLLEVLVLNLRGTLEDIRQNRSINTAFHANLDRVTTWLERSDPCSPRTYHLMHEIKAMLSKDPAKRPSAKDLLTRVAACDMGRPSLRTPSIFGNCCRTLLIPLQLYDKLIHSKQEIRNLQNKLDEAEERRERQRTKHKSLITKLESERERGTKIADQNLTTAVDDARSSNGKREEELLAKIHQQKGRIAELVKQLNSRTTVSETLDPEDLQEHPSQDGPYEQEYGSDWYRDCVCDLRDSVSFMGDAIKKSQELFDNYEYQGPSKESE